MSAAVLCGSVFIHIHIPCSCSKAARALIELQLEPVPTLGRIRHASLAINTVLRMLPQERQKHMQGKTIEEHIKSIK